MYGEINSGIRNINLNIFFIGRFVLVSINAINPPIKVAITATENAIPALLRSKNIVLLFRRSKYCSKVKTPLLKNEPANIEINGNITKNVNAIIAIM